MTRLERLCKRSGNHGSWTQHSPVIFEHLAITDLRVYERHGHAGMTKNRHDRMQLSPSLGQFCPNGMAEPMGMNGMFSLPIKESCRFTRLL